MFAVDAVYFADPVSYRAARTGAACIDRSAQGRLVVRGPDRRSWLQGLLTNDIDALEAGRGCYAACLTAQGRLVSDIRLLELGDRLLCDVPPEVIQALQARLEEFIITEDVAVEDVTGTLARVAVYGPSSAKVVVTLSRDSPVELAARLEGLLRNEHLPIASTWGQLTVARSRELRIPGFDVYCHADDRDEVIRTVTAGGAAPLNEATWEVLRIEGAIPRFGPDMDDETIPLEAGIEDEAISFTKGCYVGQEIIVRVLHRGQGRVAWKLVGLRLDQAAKIPGAGAELRRDEKEAGRLTSVALSPEAGPIALGYVHREFTAAGTGLVARDQTGESTATVTVGPFVA